MTFRLNTSLRTTIVVATIACLLSQNACKKEDATIGRTDLLTSHGWMLTKAEAKIFGVTSDVTDKYLMPCEKDDVVRFLADGTYEKSIGADDCNGAQSSQLGTWQWKTEGKAFTFTVDGTAHDVEILTLNTTTLKGSLGKVGYDFDGDGKEDIEATVTVTSVAVQ